jgi:Rieske Fe-S protein
MERREFIKTTCYLCAALSSELILGTLSSCVSYQVYDAAIEQNKIIIPLSLFTKSNVQIIRAKELDYDIALRKENDGQYTAVLLRCTHASTPLKYTGEKFVCPIHGSTFNPEGKLLEGPATRSLKKMNTIISSNSITILIN